VRQIVVGAVLGGAETAPEQGARTELVEVAAPEPIAAVRFQEAPGSLGQLVERHLRNEREHTAGAAEDDQSEEGDPGAQAARQKHVSRGQDTAG
jgi:hypothetical protein